MRKIYAFDFDGTITTRDTLTAFIRHACGTWSFLWGFLLCSPLLLLMRLRLYPNWKAKQKVIGHFFKGWSEDRFNAACRQFADQRSSLLRPKAVATIVEAIAANVEVVIVSASAVNWVAPFFERFATATNRPLILGTQVETDHGRLTGRLLGNNCYGPEKVRRIKERYPHRQEYELTAFGDSRGDKELLAYADKGYYKPFR